MTTKTFVKGIIAANKHRSHLISIMEIQMTSFELHTDYCN